MEEQLMTKADLAEFFHASASTARRFCDQHGVKPINIGNGKRTSLRWLKSDVIQMLGTLKVHTKPKDIIPRSKTSKTVLGKSANDLLKELASPIQ